jgi:hypothetical protein
MLADRAALLGAVKERLIPLLTSRGFVIYPLSSKERASAELRGAFPLGCMKRRKGADLEVVEVQFHRARFVLNFGVVPPTGVDLPWGHFAQDDVGCGGLPESYRLYRRRSIMQWFALARFGADRRQRASKTVDRVIALYPQIEAWFATRTVGPHLRKSSFPFPADVGDEATRRHMRQSEERVGSGTALVLTLAATSAGALLLGSRAVAKVLGLLALFFAAVTMVEYWNARRLGRRAGRNS